MNNTPFLLVILVYFINSHVAARDCITLKNDPCSCKYTDTQKIVSLWKIDGANSPAFPNIPAVSVVSSFSYIYNPCTSFNKGSGDDACVDDLVCQRYKDAKSESYFSVGKPEYFSTTYDAKAKQTQFRYQGGTDKSPGYTRSTVINLKCDPNAHAPTAGKVTESKDGQTSTYNFVLTTKCACEGVCPPKKSGGNLSVGSILIILFFVFLIVYFVGGFLLLKFYKHEEGTEAIPQYEFWKDLPSKIKDGCMYTKDRIKGKGSEYEAI